MVVEHRRTLRYIETWWLQTNGRTHGQGHNIVQVRPVCIRCRFRYVLYRFFMVCTALGSTPADWKSYFSFCNDRVSGAIYNRLHFVSGHTCITATTKPRGFAGGLLVMVGGAILLKSPKIAIHIVLKSPKIDAFFQSVKSNNRSG